MAKSKAQRKARRKKIIKALIPVFERLAKGLVKVWHGHHSFIITKEDAMTLTLEQLDALLNARLK